MGKSTVCFLDSRKHDKNRRTEISVRRFFVIALTVYADQPFRNS